MSDNLIARLNQFALTLDYIDKSVLDEVEGFFYNIVIDGLRACYYELSIETPRALQDDEKFLKILWCSMGDRRGATAKLFKSDKSYFSQKAHTFHSGDPVWITSSDESKILEDCQKQELIMEWNECKAIPEYRNYIDGGEAKTSILIPLRFQKETFGVLDIEFKEHIPCSNSAKEYIIKLCDTVSTILGRYISTNNSFNDTKSAFKNLRNEVSFNDLRLPGDRSTVFFAYSDDADDSVVGKIIDVITNEYSEKLKIINWKDISKPGPINIQIINSIKNSDFGICYLSEPTVLSDKFKYKDNRNVLFEAGMLHMIHKNRDDELHGWLPIRESEELSDKPPFDFAGDRILIVPRQQSGSLNDALFSDRLHGHIKASLNLV